MSAKWFSTQGIWKLTGVVLVITVQYWHWVDRSQWCQISYKAQESSGKPRITLHKIPTAHPWLNSAYSELQLTPRCIPTSNYPNFLTFFSKSLSCCHNFIFWFPQTLHIIKKNLVQFPPCFPYRSLCSLLSFLSFPRKKPFIFFARITTAPPEASFPSRPFRNSAPCIFNAPFSH